MNLSKAALKAFSKSNICKIFEAWEAKLGRTPNKQDIDELVKKAMNRTLFPRKGK